MKQKKITELEAAIAADYNNIAGMVVQKDGKPVYERYFGDCTRDSRFHIFSCTKSIVSILFGIALDKGYLDSIDRRILEFYPEYMVKRGEKTIQYITIRDMLTMTAPYKYKSNPYTKYFTSPDWVKFSLDVLGGKGQIGELVLSGGVWNGNRIVPEKWIRESTSERSRWTEQDLPYGYLWWVLEREHGCAAIGDGGNIIYINPDRNMVVAIASHFQSRVKDRIELIREYIEPAF